MLSTEFSSRLSRRCPLAAALAVGLGFSGVALAEVTAYSGETHDFHEVLADKLAAWEADALPEDLLAQIETGADEFLANCAVCHGDFGEGGSGYPNRIVGGQGLHKFRTGQRLFVYNASMMPFQEPGSIPQETIWDITAWIMAMNGWLGDADAPLGPQNARGFQIGE